MAETFPIGRHTLLIDEYRIDYLLRGDHSLADSVATMEVMDQVLKKHGFAVTYVKVIEPGRQNSDSRRYTAEWQRRTKPRGASAIVGAPPAMRLIATLYLRAVSLLYKQDSPVAFFQQEAEARAWLETHVIRLRSM